MNIHDSFPCAAASAKRFFPNPGKLVVALILLLGLALGGTGIHGVAHAEVENPARTSVEKAGLALQYTKTAKEHYCTPRSATCHPMTMPRR